MQNFMFTQASTWLVAMHTRRSGCFLRPSICTKGGLTAYQEGDDILQTLWLHAVLEQRGARADCQLQRMECIHKRLHIKLHTR